MTSCAAQCLITNQTGTMLYYTRSLCSTRKTPRPTLAEKSYFLPTRCSWDAIERKKITYARPPDHPGLHTRNRGAFRCRAVCPQSCLGAGGAASIASLYALQPCPAHHRPTSARGRHLSPAHSATWRTSLHHALAAGAPGASL